MGPDNPNPVMREAYHTLKAAPRHGVHGILDPRVSATLRLESVYEWGGCVCVWGGGHSGGEPVSAEVYGEGLADHRRLTPGLSICTYKRDTCSCPGPGYTRALCRFWW